MSNISGSGIYEIAIGNKSYIGSAINFQTRWDQHLDLLYEGEHSSPLFQQRFNRFGEDALKFRILERCDRTLNREQLEIQLEEKERKWITKYYNQGRALNTIVPGHSKWNQPLRSGVKIPKEKHRFSGIYLLALLAIATIGWWIQGLIGFWIGAIAGGILLRKKLFQ